MPFGGGRNPPRPGRGWGNSRFYGGRQGRGRGRGRGRGGRHNNHNRRNNNNNRNNNVVYNPSAFDPIEEIGDTTSSSSSVVRIAVEGCCHGELDLIYERLLDHEKTTGKKTDLLVCCGDFQSIRNPSDFHSTSIPPKYQRLGSFPKYYCGEATAPILTIFIGGNHEASQPLRELYYGGWVAPKIYYLGACGVVRYRGIRIGGISGIYKSHDYTMGHHETIPLDSRSVKSIYHVRKADVERAKLLAAGKQPLEVFVSHDWPLGIEQHGDTRRLLQRKPFFRQEIERNDLGSPPNREILNVLKPKHWFSAHLHVKFRATVVHNNNNGNANPQQEHNRNQKSNIRPTSNLLAPSQANSKAHNTKSEMAKPKPASSRSMRMNDQADAINALFAAGQINEGASQKGDDDDDAKSNTDIPQVPPVFDENNAPDTGQDATSDQAAASATQFHGLETSTSKCIPTCTDEEMAMNPVQDLTEQMTKFLALDKALPRRQFLSILNIKLGDEAATNTANNNTDKLEYDPEWLAILKNTHHWTKMEKRHVSIPPLSESSQVDVAWITKRFQEHHNTTTIQAKKPTNDPSPSFEIPETFVPTVPYYTDSAFQQNHRNRGSPLPVMGNPQTDRLLEILELHHLVTIPYDPELTPKVISERLQQGNAMYPNNDNRGNHNDNHYCNNDNRNCNFNRKSIIPPAATNDENEIDIETSDEGESGDNVAKPMSATVQDENEIELDDEDDDDVVSQDNAVPEEAPTKITELKDDNEIELDDDDDDDDDDCETTHHDHNCKPKTRCEPTPDDNEIDIDDDDEESDDEDRTSVNAVPKKARLEA